MKYRSYESMTSRYPLRTLAAAAVLALGCAASVQKLAEWLGWMLG